MIAFSKKLRIFVGGADRCATKIVFGKVIGFFNQFAILLANYLPGSKLNLSCATCASLSRDNLSRIVTNCSPIALVLIETKVSKICKSAFCFVTLHDIKTCIVSVQCSGPSTTSAGAVSSNDFTKAAGLKPVDMGILHHAKILLMSLLINAMPQNMSSAKFSTATNPFLVICSINCIKSLILPTTCSGIYAADLDCLSSVSFTLLF